ncbi:MAG TPA: SRPBCC domain-containing protein [Gemmatimonadaceae bacterium]|nr:SRPBCC domain-containing protein [Gemmatimonadaceae bacterium]
MTHASRDVPPIRRSVTVPWTPDAAYRRFVEEFGRWWPRYGHSIGGRRVKCVVFDARVGGAIYEEHYDGTRYEWGTVTQLEPPARVAFTFHAAFARADAQQVEVTFTAEGRGTRVELVSSGWERMSDHARGAYGGYRMGWGGLLARYAGRFSGVEVLFTSMAVAMDVLRQRESFTRNSEGRISSTGAPT